MNSEKIRREAKASEDNGGGMSAEIVLNQK